jgi:two-component system phosphate regulon sensor histidine kinase PhoR
MVAGFRKRRGLRWPITINVTLIVLNVGLMVCWIVLLANRGDWGALTIGTVVFAITLVGLAFYMVLTINEARLRQRQSNFVDSVTHELKTPLASMRLYVDTLKMRSLDEAKREEFYSVIAKEIERLDHMINQLLEVGRIDAIGHETEPEDIPLEPLLRQCAKTAAAHHKNLHADVFSFDVEPSVICARQMVLEMIFGNLMDNAIKYGGKHPLVEVEVRVMDRDRILTRICDNGAGVSTIHRKKIFQMFYRGGSELVRRQKGTGLGLYIVRTLVHFLKGKIAVHERIGTPGSIFEVELPGRGAA